MTQTERTARMGQDSVGRLLFQFSVPAIFGLVASALYNIVDRIFIGQVVGADGLGAVGLTFPVTVFMIAVGSLIGVGSSSQMSRMLGEGRSHQAELVLGNALTATLMISIGVFVLGGCFLDDFVRLLGATPHLTPYTREYLFQILWGLPFQLVAFNLNYLIRAEGFPRWAMGTLIIGAVANVFLDWLFIVAMGMGVSGAAIGTSLAQALSAVWVAVFYLRHVGTLRFRISALPLDGEVMKEMLLVGFSPFSTELFYTISMTLFTNVLTRYGGDVAVSAMGIFFCLDNLIYLPVMGIGEAVQPIVGYNFGASRMSRVKRTVLYAGLASFGCFLASFAVVEIFTRQMVTLFNSTDEPLIALTVRAMRIGYLGMPFAGMGIVGASVFQAIGQAGRSLFLNACRQGLVFIPALLMLPQLFGLDGVWSTFIAVDVTGGVIGTIMIAMEWNSWSRDRCNSCDFVSHQATERS